MKMNNKLRQILLPLFPENRWLKKQWWHKLIKLMVIIVSVTSLYSILWMVTLFYFMPQSWMDSPLYPPIYHLSYLIAYIPINFTSLLSRFPIYQNVFHSLLPVPIIGPIALILFLISLLYIAPSLLYRLGLYIHQRFYMKQVKIIFFVTLIGLGLFIFSTWKFQQLIDEGSVIADEQCLKVNPLIIERKNDYLASMGVIIASGSAEKYWAETNKYLEVSKKYTEAQKSWLAHQKAYMDRWDFNFFIPTYIREATKAQYNSREAQMKSTKGIVELFETYNKIDLEHQKTLSDSILEETKKSQDADDEYNRIYEASQGKFDLRNNFTTVPQSKCPPENFNIPDVRDLFNPKPVPTNYGQPLS